jgi:glycosyltransferase involved in cell wall biosynthesis
VTPDISIVIPLKNEEHNVVPLHEEFSTVMRRLGLPYELILIDDGSEDHTFARLEEVQARDSNVRVIRFKRNYGQTAGFAAGFAHARGRFIVTSDGDLQNDPADIPRMLEVAQTHDIVCGWRKNRQDTFLTRHVPSVIANWMLGVVSGVPLHDNGCALKVFRAEVIKPLNLSPGMHRYFPALASQLGGRVAEVVVHHRARRFGESKYGLSRTFTVARDIAKLPALMRQAISPATSGPPLYEIQQILESS